MRYRLLKSTYFVRLRSAIAALATLAFITATPFALGQSGESAPQKITAPQEQTSIPPASAASSDTSHQPTTAAKLHAKIQEEPKDAASESQSKAITEDELKRLLLGKDLFLRGGFLDNNLSFNENGKLVSHSAKGSYTLNSVRIERLRLTKHKLELEATRYGLHFLGQLAYESSSSAYDRVRVTPNKKFVKITIDREVVVSPKKKKNKGAAKGKSAKPSSPPTSISPSGPDNATNKDDANINKDEEERTPEEQLKASIAATPTAERPIDPDSVTTTVSPAHAASVLRNALEVIFANSLDEAMMKSLPDFWASYYRSAEQHAEFHPANPNVLPLSSVDKKPRLLSNFEPPSNEYAQSCAVAGMSLYRTVIGPDGKPDEIAIIRPIGFGLDENAVDSIRKAKFEPGFKDGRPVAVVIDLVVQFRIYSNRTAQSSPQGTEQKEAKPEDGKALPKQSPLPGPYGTGR